MPTLQKELFSDLFLKCEQATKVIDGDTKAVMSTPSAIQYDALKTIMLNTLGENVMIVTFEKPLPLSSTPKEKEAVRIAIECLKFLCIHYKKDKPLIIFFPKKLSPQNTPTDWVCSVVLLKNYEAPFGQPTDNKDHDVVFYMDPGGE